MLMHAQCVHTDNVVLMVDGQMLPSVSIQLIASTPAFGDHGRVFVDMLFDDIKQSLHVAFIVRTQRKKHVFSLPANAPNYPLTLNQTTFVIFSLAKFTFIHFNCESRSASQFGCFPCNCLQTDFVTVTNPVHFCISPTALLVDMGFGRNRQCQHRTNLQTR